MARLCEFPGLKSLAGFGAGPKQVLGTGARRAQWAKQAGGTSGNGKERLRDYSVSWVGSPNVSLHVLFIKKEFLLKNKKRKPGAP